MAVGWGQWVSLVVLGTGDGMGMGLGLCVGGVALEHLSSCGIQGGQLFFPSPAASSLSPSPALVLTQITRSKLRQPQPSTQSKPKYTTANSTQQHTALAWERGALRRDRALTKCSL